MAKFSIRRFKRDIKRGASEFKKDLNKFGDEIKKFQPKDLQLKDVFPGVAFINGKISDWVKSELTPKIPRVDIAGQRVNLSSTDQKRYVIYGTVLTGGNLVFVGEKDISGSKYLYMVLEICEGEIQSIGNVYLDDVISTDARFSGLVTITKYIGTQTQTVDADLNTQFNSTWDINHKGLGVAYLVAKLKYDKDKLNSIPTITCIVQGKKIYDPRTGTIIYSANPALCIFDFLGSLIYGLGIPTSEINVQSFVDAANYCDALITEYTSGPSIARFECNGVLDTSKDIEVNKDALLSSCMGFLIHEQGLYRLNIEKAGTSTFSFTTANILDGSWSFHGTSLESVKNRVKVNFLNASQNYTQDIATNETAVDNGMRLEQEYNLPFEINYHRALWFASTMLKKSRVDLFATFYADHTALTCQVGDIVDITHPVPGWTAKLFRIIGLTIITSGELLGCVACEVMEHDDAYYDRTVPAQDANPPNTFLPTPYTVGSVTSLSALTGATYNNKTFDGSIDYRAFVSWTAPTTGYINMYQLEFKKSADAWGTGTIKTIDTKDTQIYVDGLKVDTNYDIRVRARNDYGIDGAFSTITNINPSFEGNHIYTDERLISLDGWTVLHSGTTGATSSYADGKLTLTLTGTSDFGAAERWYRTFLYAGLWSDWTHKRRFRAKFTIPTLFTNVSSGFAGFGIVYSANGYFGIKISPGAFDVTVFDGTSVSNGALSLTPSTARIYTFDVVFTPGVSVVGTLTDELGNTSTATVTTNLPTTATGAGQYSLSVDRGNSTTGVGVLTVSDLKFEQDP